MRKQIIEVRRQEEVDCLALYGAWSDSGRVLVRVRRDCLLKSMTCEQSIPEKRTGVCVPSRAHRPYGKAGIWYDEVHRAVQKAAGYLKWYDTAGVGMAKIKAGKSEQSDHNSSVADGGPATPVLVISRVARHDSAEDSGRSLCGAIIAALRKYRDPVTAGKHPQYNLAFANNCLTDLLQSPGNMPFGNFNGVHHAANCVVAEAAVLSNINLLTCHMCPISLDMERLVDSLAKEIARLANLSLGLVLTLKRESRKLIRQAVHTQLGLSASLVRAAFDATRTARADIPGLG